MWGVVAGRVSRKRSRRSDFATTLTEESSIAAPTMTGLSRPNAASGIAAVL
jgi:hypothetical protein